MHERNAMKNSKFSLRNFFEEIILARRSILGFFHSYYSSREIYLFIYFFQKIKKLQAPLSHFPSELFEFFSTDLSSRPKYYFYESELAEKFGFSLKKKYICKENSSSSGETRLIAPYLESRRGELIELQMTIKNRRRIDSLQGPPP